MFSLRNKAWQARALWTSLASRFKDEWKVDDYPIQVWLQPTIDSLQNPPLKPVLWTARIFNWPGMSGSGDTKQEALEQLRKNFDDFRATKPSLPRPGSKVPIEFADNERVAQHEELAKDFVKRVIGVDWAWISDESSLSDFHADETDKRLTDKILEVYGVDVSDISSGNLSDIFDKIRKNSMSDG